MTYDPIQLKVYNIDLVIEDLKKSPQTYNTILGVHCLNGTLQVILRRKLNMLIKQGNVCKTTIPGTRFGKCIFYAMSKTYYILVEGTRIGSEVYYFYNYEKEGENIIKPKQCWQLKHDLWEDVGNKIFHEGNVLKFI
jgi:hypothetical protein